MKKVIAVLAIFIAVGAKAQFPKAEAKYNPNTIFTKVIGKWIAKDGAVMKTEMLSPVAIKEGIKETKKLLELIDVDYTAPVMDESVYYMDKTEEDISIFYVNASIKFSAIQKLWKGKREGKEYGVLFSVTDKFVMVSYMAY